MENKKAQVQSIAPAILALIFAAIVLVLGLVIIQELRDTDSVSITNSTGYINLESAGFNASPAITSYALSAGPLHPCTKCSIVAVSNGTTSTIVATNYSVSNCIISNLSDTNFSKDWKVNYTYTFGDVVCDSANKTLTGMATFSDFWEIIILAIITTVVIGLLLIVFGRSNKR